MFFARSNRFPPPRANAIASPLPYVAKPGHMEPRLRFNGESVQFEANGAIWIAHYTLSKTVWTDNGCEMIKRSSCDMAVKALETCHNVSGSAQGMQLWGALY